MVASSVPKYLISPGHAVAERTRWQRRLGQEMLFVVLDRPHVRWTTMARRMARDIERLPDFAREFLLNADPLDPEDAIDQYARTLGTASYNHHVLNRLAEVGITRKAWQTRHDKKVRASHRAADKQTVALSAPFIVDGQPMQFPADPRTASIDNWIGCRCVVVGRTR